MNPNEKPEDRRKPSWPGWRAARVRLLWIALVLFPVSWVVYAFLIKTWNPFDTGDAESWQHFRDWLLVLSGTVAVVFLLSLLPGLRRLFCGRNLRRFIFGVASVITLIVLFYAEENWRGKRVWENYRRAEEARGEKFDRQAFIPAPVPDDQNFAMTPFFAPMFDFKPGTQEWTVTNWNQQAEDFRKKVGDMELKAPETARSNSWVRSGNDLPAWYAAFLQSIPPKTVEPALANTATPELATKVLAALTPVNPVLEEIRSASRRPQARFNLRYENDDPAAILLPHLATLKQLTLVLLLRSSAELTLGRTDEAFADIHLMFYLMETVRSEPILISQLVRTAQLQLTLQPIAQGLENHQWSDAQLQGFQQRLEACDFCADTRFALQAERVLFGGGILDYFRQLSSRERIRLFDAVSQWPPPDTHSAWPAFYAGVIPTGWYYLEQLNYDRAYQKFLLPIVDAENRRISPGLARQSIEEIERAKSPDHAFPEHRIFSALLLPALPGIAQKAARAQDAADLADIACALERYRLANGKYPPMLAALVPPFLPRLPHDVITGEPPHYRLRDDGRFVLYSAGWNEKDDGGAISWDKDHHVDWDNGDWVWGYPAK